MRAKLGEISRQTGRSIAAECESQIEQSFKDEQTLDQVIGLLFPGKLATLVRQVLDVARVVSSVRITLLAEGAQDVLDNPWRFDQLASHQPRPRGASPPEEPSGARSRSGERAARRADGTKAGRAGAGAPGRPAQ